MTLEYNEWISGLTEERHTWLEAAANKHVPSDAQKINIALRIDAWLKKLDMQIDRRSQQS